MISAAVLKPINKAERQILLMSITSRRVVIALASAAVVVGAFFAAYRITLWGTRSQSLPAPEASVPAEESVTAAIAGLPGEHAEQTSASAAAGAAAPDPADPSAAASDPASPAAPAAEGETTTASAPPESPDSPEETVSPTYIHGILIVNKSYPLPSTYGPGDLTDECASAFEEMREAAAEQGLELYVSSGFRSYELQASLYQRYCDSDGQEAADTYSARPGHSEHQTGLAIDLNTISSSFANTAEGQWVAEHCWEYGFILRYPADKVDITGYMYEPWHIRYLGKTTAKAVYDSGLCLEEFLGVDSVYRY